MIAEIVCSFFYILADGTWHVGFLVKKVAGKLKVLEFCLSSVIFLRELSSSSGIFFKF